MELTAGGVFILYTVGGQGPDPEVRSLTLALDDSSPPYAKGLIIHPSAAGQWTDFAAGEVDACSRPAMRSGRFPRTRWAA